MQAGGIIDGLPLWALYLITAALVLLATEAGWRLGNYVRQRPHHEKEAPVGAVVGATLGLLAFLLAFTFGMAASRYDTRKQLVLEEANAIGTAYLRAEMLPEPQRSDIRNLLREYAGLRVAGCQRAHEAGGYGAVERSSTTGCGPTRSSLARKIPDSEIVALFVESLNEMIDLDETASRPAATGSRIPSGWRCTS